MGNSIKQRLLYKMILFQLLHQQLINTYGNIRKAHAVDRSINAFLSIFDHSR